jgi:hypothetical protein
MVCKGFMAAEGESAAGLCGAFDQCGGNVDGWRGSGVQRLGGLTY